MTDLGLSEKSLIFVFERSILLIRHVDKKKCCAFLARVKFKKLNNRMISRYSGFR